MSGEIRCPSCGTINQTADQFCGRCGARLSSTSPSVDAQLAPSNNIADVAQPMAEFKKQRSVWTVVFGGATIALLIVVILTQVPLSLTTKGVGAYNAPALKSQISTLSSQLASNMSEISNLDSQVFSLQSQISADQSSISQLQSQTSSDASQIQNLENQVASDQNQISADASRISSLESQMSNLQSITSLTMYSTWASGETFTQPAGYYTYLSESTQYAGYIVVSVQSSTTSTTYAMVQWNADGVSYSQQITVGYSGTVVFPVLPASSVTVGVGNSNYFDSATEIVTLTYWY